MIKLFRTLQPANILLLLGYTFIMRLAVFFYLPEKLTLRLVEPYTAVIIDLNNIEFSPAINVILSSIIIFIQALCLNWVVNKHALLGKASYLSALMYVTGMSIFLSFSTLSAPLLCNFIVIIIIYKFLNLAKSNDSMSILFDIGMLLALGTLLYFPMTLMLLMLFLGLLLYRSFNWREWIVGILGYFVVFWLVIAYYFWNDLFIDFVHIWQPLTNKFPSKFPISFNDYLVLAPIAIITIIALFNLQDTFFRSFVHTRKAFQMLFFLFVIALLSFYTKTSVTISHFIICVPPIAILFAFYFTNSKKAKFYETLFILLVLSIQYFLFV